MSTHRRALAALAGASSIVLALATLNVSLAANPPTGSGLTKATCQAADGVFASVNGTKTCTTVVSMTFLDVGHSMAGPFELLGEGGWIRYEGGWASTDVVTIRTTMSQKGDGPITESSSQTTDYEDIDPSAFCGQANWDADGNWTGAGQVDNNDNRPCKERGLLPENALDYHVPPPEG